MGFYVLGYVADLTVSGYGDAGISQQPTCTQVKDNPFCTFSCAYHQMCTLVPTTNEGAKSRLAYFVQNNNGEFKTFCGAWDTSGKDIEPQYLPKSCTCTNLNDPYTNSTATNMITPNCP